MHLCKADADSRANVLKVSLMSLLTGAIMNHMQFKFLSYLPFASESGEAKVPLEPVREPPHPC